RACHPVLWSRCRQGFHFRGTAGFSSVLALIPAQLRTPPHALLAAHFGGAPDLCGVGILRDERDGLAHRRPPGRIVTLRLLAAPALPCPPRRSGPRRLSPARRAGRGLQRAFPRRAPCGPPRARRPRSDRPSAQGTRAPPSHARPRTPA